MARNMYSSYRGAGLSSGKYRASLYDFISTKDEMDFIDVEKKYEQQKLSKNIEDISSLLEVVNTVAMQGVEQQKFETEIAPLIAEERLEKEFNPVDYGLGDDVSFEDFKLYFPQYESVKEAYMPTQEPQNLFQRIIGEERTYTFADDDMKYSESRLKAMGKLLSYRSFYEDMYQKSSRTLFEEAGIQNKKEDNENVETNMENENDDYSFLDDDSYFMSEKFWGY